MGLKVVSGLMLTLLLVSMVSVVFDVPVVVASGTIYIRADGSIDPPTANITTIDNITYTLADNIYDDIVVQRSNIVIDGNQCTVQGSGIWYGFDISGIENVTIKNTNIKGFEQGIFINWSPNCSIFGNNITTNKHFGVWLLQSPNCNISGNDISGNSIAGTDWGGISLESSSNCQVSGNNITTNNGVGLLLYRSSNCSVFGNNITTNAKDGIYLYDSSSYNNVSQNYIANNYYSGVMFQWSSFNNTISGNDVVANEHGIHVLCSNNSIIANNITANDYGIYVAFSNCNIFENNVTANTRCGIWLFYSSNNILCRNVINNNTYNFGVSGTEFSNYMHSIDTSNSVNGKPIYYYINQTDLVINSTTHPKVGFLALINSVNITVEDLTLTNNYEGLLFAYTNSSKIRYNNITDNEIGIVLWNSSNHNVSANNVTDNYSGIHIENSNNNSISANYIAANDWHGIALWSSSNNTLSENNLTTNGGNGLFIFLSSTHNIINRNSVTANNLRGIRLSSSSNYNIVNGNNVTDNDLYGISILDSSNNTISGNNIINNVNGIEVPSSSDNRIYHNNFVNNTSQFNNANALANNWDDGYPSGGNYWSDYAGVDFYCGQYQNLTGSDGIGDTAYPTDANKIDNYPFTKLNGWQNYPILIETNITVTNKITGRTAMYFTASGPNGQIGYINATMPKGFNTTEIKVFIDDVRLTPPPFPIITSNDTHYFIYFEFTLSTHQIIIQYAITDVAVTNVTPSKTVVGQGYSVSINVTAANQGNYSETFSVTVYANTTIIETKEMTLTSGNSTTLTVIWNTSGFAKGNYTISAIADTVPGETDLDDNNCTDGSILIAKVGDFGGLVDSIPTFFACDNKVDGIDLALFIHCYKKLAGNAQYLGDLGGLVGPVPTFFACDGKVDGVDLALFIACYQGLGPPDP